MNVKLLRKVRDYIAKHPEKYGQGDWCGTKCCIAGHTLVIGHAVPRKVMDARGVVAFIRANRPDLVDLNRGFYTNSAGSLLGLSESEARRLFLTWPSRFRDSLESAHTAAERSRIAVKRINHFIKTRGAE